MAFPQASWTTKLQLAARPTCNVGQSTLVLSIDGRPGSTLTVFSTVASMGMPAAKAEKRSWCKPALSSVMFSICAIPAKAVVCCAAHKVGAFGTDSRVSSNATTHTSSSIIRDAYIVSVDNAQHGHAGCLPDVVFSRLHASARGIVHLRVAMRERAGVAVNRVSVELSERGGTQQNASES